MSRIPSTSIGTRSSTRSARAAVSTSSRKRVARGRQDQRLGRELGQRDRLRPRRGRSDDGTSATSASSRRCSTWSRVIAHRFGHDRARELALGDLAREALRRALGEPQRQTRRASGASRPRPSARADGSPFRRHRGSRGPVSSPCSIDRSLCSASISLRIARARSMTRTPNSVGTVPRRPRTSSCTPSSASSWRTCSETFDWTVCSWSAAVGEAARLGHGQERFELANIHVDLLGWRILVRPGDGPNAAAIGPGGRLLRSHRYYRSILSFPRL